MASPEPNFTDIRRHQNTAFIYTCTPLKWHPYLTLARFDRPTGFMLLFWPCCWGLTLAGAGWEQWPLFLLFFIGSILMRSAGCIINDMIDAKLDQKVERTAMRPLASGELSFKQALIFLQILFLLALIILLHFNPLTITLGFLSLGLIMTYPFMKRITYWPQLFLGFTFNWGILMGYTSIANTFSLDVLLLYITGILWTLIYDTVYAHQDIEDDLKIGIKSTAIKLHSHTKPILTFFIGGMTVLMISLGYNQNASPYYYGTVICLMMTYTGLLWRVPLTSQKSCLRFFKINTLIGGSIWFVLLLLTT